MLTASDEENFQYLAAHLLGFDLGGGAVGDDISVLDEREPMTMFSFIHVMCSNKNGNALGNEFVKQIPECAAGKWVNACSGFIEEEYIGAMQDRRTEREALTPTTREFPGFGMFSPFQPRHLQSVIDSVFQFRIGYAVCCTVEIEVL